MKNLYLPLVTLAVLTVLADNILANEGCFQSNSLYGQPLETFSYDACQEKCTTQYMALTISDNMCYCGDDIAEQSIPRDASLCTDLCPGTNRTCGGLMTMSLYKLREFTPSLPTEEVAVLIGLNGSLKIHNPGNGSFDDVMTSKGNYVVDVDYHHNESLVFGLFNHTSVEVTNFGTSELKNSTILESKDGICSIAVDWMLNRLYHTTRNSSIISSNLNGTDHVTVFNQTRNGSHCFKNLEVDPYQQRLFWVADGSLETFSLSDRKFERLNGSTSFTNVRAVSLDLAAQRVFAVVQQNQMIGVFSVNYTGGELRSHGGATRTGLVLGLSVYNESIYWANNDASNVNVLYKTPMSSNKSVEKIYEFTGLVSSFKLSHSSLQRNACETARCNQTCTPLSATKVQCGCRTGFSLGDDSFSCSENETSPSSSASGIIIAVAAVIVVLSLLGCLAIKFRKDPQFFHRTVRQTLSSNNRSTATNYDNI